MDTFLSTQQGWNLLSQCGGDTTHPEYQQAKDEYYDSLWKDISLEEPKSQQQ